MNSVVAFPLTEHERCSPARTERQLGRSSPEFKSVRAIHQTSDRSKPESSKRPSPEAVRIQLSKILQSQGFVNAKRMGRFLKFIVEETLAGRASDLCEYSVGISVFERDESFEPSLDPIVRNDARRLRQKVLEYYQRLADCGDEQIFIEIPKGGYVPVFSSMSPSAKSNGGGPYRLTISLIRLGDATEICAKQYDFESSDGFTMHLEVKRRAAGQYRG
jgi:hypothetical protein